MTLSLSPRASFLPHPRTALVAGGVVLLHVAALWALQAGLVRRVAEVVVPVELLSVMVTPPQAEAPPAPPPPAPPPPAPTPPPPRPVAQKPRPVPRPVAAPRPAPVPAPMPDTATAVAEPQQALPPLTTPVAPAPAPAAPPAPPAPAPVAKVELPTTVADYLQNPAPAYPRMSFRLGEQGTSIVRVLVGADGLAQDARIGTSSGYDRLDRAAVATARSWRYVPGKRGGVAEAMWVNVPIRWEIR